MSQPALLRVPPFLRVAVLALAFTSCATAPTPVAAQDPPPDPTASAEGLLDAIRARYADSWYRTLSFVQTTTFHTPQGPQTQTWYEAAATPGRLRIDVAPLGAGNTFLVVGDSTHIAQGGRVVQRRPDGNPLLFLGFDLPFLTTAEGLAGMRAIGIDTDAVRVEPWQGREAIVVGGAPGDTTSAQVWFDRERLVFVRLIELENGSVQDIRFDDYEPLAGGWVAPRVEIYADGRLVMEEDYRAVQADVDLPAGTFDPQSWPATDWWTAVGYDGTE